MSSSNRFDPEIVQRVRWYAARGESDWTLADALGVTVSAIYAIRTRRSYRDVPEPPWGADWLLDEAREVDEPIFTAERDHRWAARLARRRQRRLDAATKAGLP